MFNDILKFTGDISIYMFFFTSRFSYVFKWGHSSEQHLCPLQQRLDLCKSNSCSEFLFFITSVTFSKAKTMQMHKYLANLQYGHGPILTTWFCEVHYLLSIGSVT